MCLEFGRKAFKSIFSDHEKLQSMGIPCGKGSPSIQLAFMAVMPNMFLHAPAVCVHIHTQLCPGIMSSAKQLPGDAAVIRILSEIFILLSIFHLCIFVPNCSDS